MVNSATTVAVTVSSPEAGGFVPEFLLYEYPYDAINNILAEVDDGQFAYSLEHTASLLQAQAMQATLFGLEMAMLLW